jgi:prepilin-type N-terminal cleavage/methylation domain-containing protein
MKINSNRGFSLLEVMFSTAILTLTLSAFLYSLNQSRQLAELARNQNIAINAAREKLEEISLSNLSALQNQTFPVVDSNGKALLTPAPTQTNPLSVVVTKTNMKPGSSNSFVDVKVTVQWQERSGKVASQELKTTFFVGSSG